MRARRYDAVIDTQGLLKSALIACSARGASYGLDWKSAREPLALFYNRTFAVPWTLHAVERNRALAGRALGYAVPNGVDYGIRAPAGRVRVAAARAVRRAAARHEPGAQAVARTRLGRAGDACWRRAARRCVLPWHGADERARSERLAREIPGAVVPPALALADMAGLIAGAAAVAGVDTGLTHLAAAFGDTDGRHLLRDRSRRDGSLRLRARCQRRRRRRAAFGARGGAGARRASVHRESVNSGMTEPA